MHQGTLDSPKKDQQMLKEVQNRSTTEKSAMANGFSDKCDKSKNPGPSWLPSQFK